MNIIREALSLEAPPHGFILRKVEQASPTAKQLAKQLATVYGSIQG
jgi:hypothetical protein